MRRLLIAPFLAWAKSFSPWRLPYHRLLLALVIGAAGGWLFSLYRLPLAWMLGSMVACTVAALLRAPVAAPAAIRPPVQAVLGVMLGAGFAPGMIASVPGWLPTLIGLVGFVIVAGAVGTLYMRKVAGLDPVTAFFSGMPGGLVEMVIQGEERGGDVRMIALVHSARVFVVVMSLPFLLQWITGVDIGARPNIGLSLLDTPAADILLLIGTLLAGVVAGQLLRLPARFLLGPMLASALLHVSGLTDFVIPVELLNAAQLLLGMVVGCRFATASPRVVLRVLVLAVGANYILLAITFAFAFAVSAVSTYDVTALVMAYSPGGLAEMSLVALALQIEVAFVAAHHLARVVMVMAFASTAFRLSGLGGPPQNGGEDPPRDR